MKALSWLKYFVYLLLIVLILWVQGVVQTVYQNDYSKTYQMNYVLYALYVSMPVIVGAVIGLEALIRERAKAGKWKLNLPKLILIVLPSLYAYSFYFIVLLNNETIYNIFIDPFIKFFGNSAAFITILQLLLGYSLITIMHKVEPAKEVIAENQVFDENDGKEEAAIIGQAFEATSIDGAGEPHPQDIQDLPVEEAPSPEEEK
jgi:hypothetical protein